MTQVLSRPEVRTGQQNEGTNEQNGSAPLISMSSMQVLKRDGRVVSFDSNNIRRAVNGALSDVDSESDPVDQEDRERIISTVVSDVEKQCLSRFKSPVHIEDIQNLVEHSLINQHAYDVARAYTSYRLNRDIKRAKATDVNEQVNRFLSHDPAIVHENANKDSNVYSTQRDLLAGTISRAAALRMLPKDVANAHLKGDIHFHDADYSPFTAETNCSLPNFGDMLSRGFTLGNAQMSSPKSIETAATQITQIIKDIAGSQYGGQTVNRADEMMAPYAKLDYQKNLDIARTMLPDNIPESIAENIIHHFHEMQSSWLHFEPDRPNIPLDKPFHTDCSRIEQLREVYAKLLTRKNIYDAMQTMEYQINSNRVSNGQTPFVTIGFGLGTDWFAREITRAIFLNRIRGLGSQHRTAIFPKLTYTIKYGLNSKPGDPNYDLKQLALECSTKRMYPDILFYENIVKITGSFKAPMGCRSFLQGWVNPKTGKDEEDGRMNLGVVTVNIPRVALESNGDKDKFWKLLDQRLAVAHHALQFRITRCEEAKPKNAPVLYENGAFGRLKANDDVSQLFKNSRATVSLGYIGLAEATAVFYGKNWIKDHSWDPEGKAFALSIVKKLHDACAQWEKEEGYHYSVYSTPAESLTDRFNRMDRQKFGRVPGVTDHDFYTNSFHYPVWLKPTPFEKLDYEKDFPQYAAGGFIHYCEYPTLQQNPKALEAVWDYAHKIGIGYLGTNTPIDECYVCGYKGDFEPTEDGFKCPECGNHDPAKCSVTKRTCGYLGNPLARPMVHGRHEEIIHRAKHMDGETGRVTLSNGSTKEWWDDQQE